MLSLGQAHGQHSQQQGDPYDRDGRQRPQPSSSNNNSSSSAAADKCLLLAHSLTESSASKAWFERLPTLTCTAQVTGL